jgi:hypothetical protein
MEFDSLNFFAPFRRLEANHENQLTRALLVVLRYSPMAHAAWLRIVEPDRQLHELPTPTFVTQQRALRYVGEDEPEAELISVYLAPEEPLSDDEVVVDSDRGQVLDAIIDYGGAVIVVIENKVAESDDWQARNINVDGARVRIVEGQRRVPVLWRDVLEAFAGLRERELVSGAEATLLEDFLVYVEDHFPSLGPFGTLALCHGNDWRIMRRLRQVLGEASEAEAIADQWGPLVRIGSDLVRSAYLRLNEEEGAVELSLYPADTLTQARAFYARPEVIESVRALGERPGWGLEPNFHFGFVEKGLCWSYGGISADDYIELWTERVNGGEGQISREDWDRYWSGLVELRVVDSQSRAQFDRDFTNTSRNTASPRPGLWLGRRWSVVEAEELDSAGRFTSEVQDALNAALAACDASLERSPSATA